MKKVAKAWRARPRGRVRALSCELMPPPADPDLVTRFYRRCTPLFFVYMGLGMATASTWGRTLTAGLGIGGSLAVWILPGVIWLVVVITWERRLVGRLRATGYRLCPACGYSLVGREGPVTCPECGRPCVMDDVQRMWRDFRPRISGALRIGN